MYVQIAEDVYQARLPLPFALNRVNCYLLRGKDGWTVVDTGIHTPEGETTWRSVFGALHLRPRDIRLIVLTHAHPDHYGMAGWLQTLCREDGAAVPVRMSAREAESAQNTWVDADGRRDQFITFFRQCGMPEGRIVPVADGFLSTRQMTFPHPEQVEIVQPGEKVVLGDRTFNAIHAPGHSDGQLLFYDPADRLMLCGDHVLMKITPNIGLWPDNDPEPLARFFASLRDLQTLDVRLALPGHKAVITDWRERIGELLRHHDARLERTLAACEQGATVYQASQHIFDMGQFSHHEWRFAMVEALAHLDYLLREGKLRCEERDGVWVYHQKA
jgi:glyoxylase-like metal-dependent hydrolase (beta-lactamase superfamily II)